MSRPATFRLWDNGKNRFAVTLEPNTVPVLGYVSRNSDKTWRAERGGAILPSNYKSVAEAAEALIELAQGDGD